MNIEELQVLLAEANTASNSGNCDEAELLANKVLEGLDSATVSAEGSLSEVETLRANALLSLGTTECWRGNYATTLEYARQALAHAEEHSLVEVTPKCMNLFGKVYVYLSDYPRALEYLVKALAAHEELGNKAGVAYVTGNIGGVYYSLSDYPRALEYLVKALAAFEELGDKAGAATVTGNIGGVYATLSDYPFALEYYVKALAVKEELGDKAGAARVTGNIGNVYSNLSDYPRALEYLVKALAAHEELGNKAGVAYVTGNIGGVYYSLSDYPRALEYYVKALAAHEELGNKAGAASVTGNIGSLYEKKDFEDYNPEKAEEYLLKAIAIFEEIGAKQYHFHKSLADLYENQERWKESQFHFKKFYELEKEVQSEEAKKQAEKQDTDRKLAIERAQAASEKKILNNILPKEITARLIKGENPIADHFDSVSVLFMDIVDFTPLASSITAQQLVHLLNAIFSAADGVMRECGLEKIKTIGDAYMAVAGAPVVQADHAHRAAQAALRLLDVMQNLVVTFPDNYGDKSWIASIPEVQVRIGLHCGSAVAGVVGENKFLYDLWGDAVNTASRMESHGEAGRIHVSEEFKNAVGESSFSFVVRAKMDIKGKGTMITYFLEKAKP
ncbi:MAG: tetratricopeptide repeat protein [Bacteroidetes bacterium]|nr:tetratricopeptide repeat protein [Bacteroidota bacterium]